MQSECLAICEFLTNVEAPLDKESLGPLEAGVSAQEQFFVRQASQLLQVSQRLPFVCSDLATRCDSCIMH